MSKVKIEHFEFGFVVLSPEHNVGRVRSTVVSIQGRHPKAPLLCVVGDRASDGEMSELGRLCPTVKGRGTITSLINTGIAHTAAPWNMFVFEGACVGTGLVKKMATFATGADDILFPISANYDKQGKMVAANVTFPDSPLSGLLVHRDTFRRVGNMSDNPLEVSKLLWAIEANDAGCVFKGIVGAKLL